MKESHRQTFNWPILLQGGSLASASRWITTRMIVRDAFVSLRGTEAMKDDRLTASVKVTYLKDPSRNPTREAEHCCNDWTARSSAVFANVDTYAAINNYHPLWITRTMDAETCA